MVQDISPRADGSAVFHPSRRLHLLYNLYLLIIVWLLVIPCLILLMIYLTPVTRLFISISALFIALSALLWLRKYYESITCILGPDAITLQRGVWIRRTITVPYKKITGIDIIRKRLHSYLGISSLRVNYTTSESLHAVIRIDGTQDPERLHSIIINNLNAVPGQG